MNRTESEQLVELMELNSIEDVSIGKAEVLVITLGSDGSRYIARDGSSETVPAVKIRHVVDTGGEWLFQVPIWILCGLKLQRVLSIWLAGIFLCAEAAAVPQA